MVPSSHGQEEPKSPRPLPSPWAHTGHSVHQAGPCKGAAGCSGAGERGAGRARWPVAHGLTSPLCPVTGQGGRWRGQRTAGGPGEGGGRVGPTPSPGVVGPLPPPRGAPGRFGLAWPERGGASRHPGAPARGALRSLTALSIPRVSSMTKKTTAQTEDSGSVASASG